MEFVLSSVRGGMEREWDGVAGGVLIAGGRKGGIALWLKLDGNDWEGGSSTRDNAICHYAFLFSLEDRGLLVEV
jgi:hypothetical protein